MRCVMVVRSAACGPETKMPRRKQNDHEEVAATLRAARLFVGEADAPITSEEVALRKEIVDELPRPDAADLAALAQQMVKR